MIKERRGRSQPRSGQPWRFEPADSSDRLRTKLEVTGLVWLASGALTLAGHVDGRPLHYLERVWARGAIRHLQVDIRWEGIENVDSSQTYAIAPLHEGFVDVLPLLSLPLNLRFVVRDELFAQPGLGMYLRAARHISVPTWSRRRDLLRLYRRVGETFDEGRSLVMFPQGTILGIEAAFRPGPARLARHFERPLLPIVLSGSHRVWEHPYTPTLRYGVAMTAKILEPIAPSDLGPEAWRRLERRMKRLALDSDTPPRHFLPERDGWWDDYDYEIDPDFPELAGLTEAHRNAASTHR